jgi:hypothetical protein
LPSRMLREGDYKFVYTHGVINQLYNVAEDPNELNNLVLDKKYQEMEKDLCFQTLVEWRPQEYNILKASCKSRKLKWEAFDGAKSYVIYHAETNNPVNANALAEVEGTDYKIQENGFYWIMAIPELTRTTQRMGDIPVFVPDYTMKMPISNVISF